MLCLCSNLRIGSKISYLYHNLMYKKVQQSLLYDMLLYRVNHVAVTCP